MKPVERLLNEGISLESSLNFISDGLVIINVKFEIIHSNSAAHEICGVVGESEFKSWSKSVGVYQRDKKTFFEADKLPLARAMRGELVKNVHLYLKNESLEEWKTVSCNASPILNGTDILGAIVTFHDLTEILQKEEELNKERASYHKILNSIPASIFAKDLKGNVTFLNDKAREELGWNVSLQDEVVIQSKKGQEFEVDYFHQATGEVSHFKTTRIPLLDHKNEIYGVCGISYNVTAEMAHKKKLEEDKAKIATASKLAALGMLAAELGHEINNPLAIIRTSSWIMRKVLNSEPIQREVALGKLDEIDGTVQRISEIVISVKNLSRDSSAEKKTKHLLSEILRDVQSICMPKFQAKGIKYVFDEENPLLTKEIECFRVQLSEVLINLIVNAVDAVEELDHPWIKFEMKAEGENLVFRVSDSGAGVSPEIEKKIFTPFFSTKEVGKGTGLGLSISKEIMHRQGGELSLNRRISPSCFEVTLPHGKKC